MITLEHDDWRLLADYADHKSQDAFARLVARYADMVFHTALRRTHDRDLAEDATQAVFIVLARSAGKLSPRGSLGAWLHRTAMNAAANAVRAQSRRRRNERAAATRYDEAVTPAETDQKAETIRVVEEELQRLGESDRTVLAMHYLEGKTMPKVANLLGVSGEAARKRLTRALERLRARVSRRDAALTPAVVLGALSGIAAAPSAAPAAQITAPLDAGGADGRAFALAAEIMRATHLLMLKKAAAIVALCVMIIGGATVLATQRAMPAAAPAPVAQADEPGQTPAEIQTRCMLNLRNLGLAFRLAMHKDKLPADMGSLLPFVPNPPGFEGKATPAQKAKNFICPFEQGDVEIPQHPTPQWINDNTSYVYLAGEDVSLPEEDHDSTVLMHDKLDHPHPGDVIAVVMLDGHCEILPVEDALELIEESKERFAEARKPRRQPR